METTNLMPAAPEIVLLALICVVLVVDLFLREEDRAVTFWVSLGTLVLTGAALVATAPEASTLIFDGVATIDAVLTAGFPALAVLM